MQLRQYQEGHIDWFYTKNMMADLPILHFRNPLYNSFLENIVCIVLQLFVPAAAVYLWIFV